NGHGEARRPDPAVQMTHPTHVGHTGINIYLNEGPKESDDPLERWVRLSVSSSILGGGGLLSTYQDERAQVDGKPLPPAKFEAMLRRLVTWRDAQNVDRTGCAEED